MSSEAAPGGPREEGVCHRAEQQRAQVGFLAAGVPPPGPSGLAAMGAQVGCLAAGVLPPGPSRAAAMGAQRMQHAAHICECATQAAWTRLCSALAQQGYPASWQCDTACQLAVRHCLPLGPSFQARGWPGVRPLQGLGFRVEP